MQHENTSLRATISRQSQKIGRIENELRKNELLLKDQGELQSTVEKQREKIIQYQREIEETKLHMARLEELVHQVQEQSMKEHVTATPSVRVLKWALDQQWSQSLSRWQGKERRELLRVCYVMLRIHSCQSYSFPLSCDYSVVKCKYTNSVRGKKNISFRTNSSISKNFPAWSQNLDCVENERTKTGSQIFSISLSALCSFICSLRTWPGVLTEFGHQLLRPH